MASKTNWIILSFSFFLFISASHADLDSICKLTPHPSFCKSFLSPFNTTNLPSLHNYGRISLSHSLSNAKNFLSFLNNYSSTTSPSSVTDHDHHHRVLRDCVLLSQLDVDFLSRASDVVRSKDASEGYEGDDLMTWLSAVITNQETCLEGLLDRDLALPDASSASLLGRLLVPRLSDLKLFYSVSLGLLKHGWVRDLENPVAGRWLAEQANAASLIKRDRSVKGRMVLDDERGREIRVSRIVVVNSYGTGNFITIEDAVAAAPNDTEHNDGYYVIHLESGVYNEYVTIPKNKRYVMMIGDGINRTVITGNRSVIDGWTTFNSATFAVLGQGFVAMNITFRNTAGPSKHQAVAVRNGADKSTFYTCSFEGYQDTLYTHSQRQFYKNCDIFGTIDYIFGNAAVVFQNCNIYSRLPLDSQFNSVTAQGRTDPNQNTGTSIQNCTVLAASDLRDSNRLVKTYLGRPWKEYSRTVVMSSFLDGLIDPSGWAPWNESGFAQDTLYYAEFNNRGPGSSTRDRVDWSGYHVVVDSSDVRNFTVSEFLGGNSWLPLTGVPYTSGLE
ncbi:Probable pectinesterase/pectinesterase inhibitor 41 [Linum grandiflorum]